MLGYDRKARDDCRRYNYKKTKKTCLRCRRDFISITKTIFLCNSCKKQFEDYDLKLCMSTEYYE